MMELIVQEPKRSSKDLPNGQHQGTITAVEYRDYKEYSYCDLIIETNDKIVIKASFPAFVSPTSKLGKLLVDFGGTLEIGKGIDPEHFLVGKVCTFLSMKNDKGYANIVAGSIHPVK